MFTFWGGREASATNPVAETPLEAFHLHCLNLNDEHEPHAVWFTGGKGSGTIPKDEHAQEILESHIRSMESVPRIATRDAGKGSAIGHFPGPLVQPWRGLFVDYDTNESLLAIRHEDGGWTLHSLDEGRQLLFGVGVE